MPPPAGYPCAVCHGHRLHRIKVHRDTVDGKLVRVTRVRHCTVCETMAHIDGKQQPGIACPQCGDSRLLTRYTRHRGPGVTVRVKRCVACKHEVRTVESVESFAHKRAA